MKILFDICHPAHVHLFKNFIRYLKSNNHQVIITGREKDVTNQLLDNLGFDYLPISIQGTDFSGRLKELLKRDKEIIKLHQQHHFDIAFGSSVSIAHLSLLSQVKSFNFTEDDDNVVPFYTYLTYPFTTKIVNPNGLIYQYWKQKRILYPSYQELAYLHPNNFKANRSILNKYKLEPGEYIVIRKSSLNAHHDTHAKGLGNKMWNHLLERISDFPSIISYENDKTHAIEPWDMHHILAFSRLVVSDSQTMSAEAAVLGVPSIRYNTFVGKLSYLNELEHRYQLTFGFLPGQENECLSMLENLLQDTELVKIWAIRRKEMLQQKIDFNQWMIDSFNQIAP